MDPAKYAKIRQASKTVAAVNAPVGGELNDGGAS